MGPVQWQRKPKTKQTSLPNDRVVSPRERSLSFRIHAVYALVFLACTGLVLRLSYVQIGIGAWFRSQAQTVTFSKVPVLPARGWVYDANGNLLAFDKPSYSVYFTRLQQVPQDVPAMAAALAPAFAMSPDAVARLMTDNKEYATVRLFKDIDDKQLSFLQEHHSDFPGISVSMDSQRYYKYGDLAGQLLGYVGPILPGDRDRYKDYLPIQSVGETGIEKQYEKQLQGTVGNRVVEVNSSGISTKQLGYAPAPTAGDYLQLCLDGHLQAIAQQAVMDTINQSKYKAEIHSGAAVMLDVNTGGVLAMVSYPYYDPNWYTGSDYLKHQQYLRSSGAQMNFAIQGPNYPGSTVKPANLITGLEAGVVWPSMRFLDRNSTRFGTDTTLHDDTNHGVVTPVLAISESCETFFYELGLSLGKWLGVTDKSGGYPAGGQGVQTWRNTSLAKGMNALFQGEARFGLGEATGIDLPNEETGRFWIEDASGRPVPYHWKKAVESIRETGKFLNYGSPADLAFAATGQAQQYTPMQLAQYAMTIANNGKKLWPHVLKAIYPPNMDAKLTAAAKPTQVVKPVVQDVLKVKPEFLKIVQRGMYEVCNDPRGTAYGLFHGTPYKAAGKTGTAQIVMDGKQQYNSVFVGYAPYDHPLVAIAVMVPGGGYGAETSAQIARKMMDAYFQEHRQFFPQNQWQNTDVPSDWMSWEAYRVPEEKK